MNFTRNEVRGEHLVFSKKGFQGFISEILRVAGLLEEKFTFFNSLETTKISKNLRLSVYINVVLLTNLPEEFESCFYFKYSRSYVTKFYSLGDKTFETYFSITKQLKFLNSCCSIICSYCSVVCLISKNELKNDRIFKIFEIKRNSDS